MALSAIDKLRKPQDCADRPSAARAGRPLGTTRRHHADLDTPAEIDAVVRQDSERQTRHHQFTCGMRLPRQHGATITCPVTTGIFISIVARAASRDGGDGSKARAAPWWRVLKTGGALNEKYPGGTAAQKKRLAAEGFRIVKKGKSSLMVEDFETRLAKL